MKRPLWFAALSLAVLSVGAGPAAFANSVGPITTSTPIPLTLTDWSGSLSFSQFNPSLGTLTAVELAFSGGLQTQLTVTNNSDSALSGNATTEVQITVQDAGSNLTAPELSIYSTAYSYSLGAGDNTTSPVLTGSDSSDNTYTLGAVLSEFTGLGTISLPASTFTQTLLANTGGNTAASQATDANLTGTVTYTYTPVVTPEPSCVVLLGIGAFGLLAFAWRRRRTA